MAPCENDESPRDPERGETTVDTTTFLPDFIGRSPESSVVKTL
jgi:hypothetical protein